MFQSCFFSFFLLFFFFDWDRFAKDSAPKVQQKLANIGTDPHRGLRPFQIGIKRKNKSPAPPKNEIARLHAADGKYLPS